MTPDPVPELPELPGGHFVGSAAGIPRPPEGTPHVVDCSKPHTQEVYAVGSTKAKVSTGPSADSDPELYRICRTDVDLRIISALNASRVADAGFLIGSDRTGRVVCTAITDTRTGSVVDEFLATA